MDDSLASYGSDFEPLTTSQNLNATQDYEDDHESESEGEYDNDFEEAASPKPELPRPDNLRASSAIDNITERLAHTMPLSITDLKDIIAELPEGFQAPRSYAASPFSGGGHATPAPADPEMAGIFATFNPEPQLSILVEASPSPTTSNAPLSPRPPTSPRSPFSRPLRPSSPPSPPPPAVDMDNVVLRLLLHTALLDLPPQPQPPTDTMPSPLPSYCDTYASHRQARHQAPTISGVMLDRTFPPAPPHTAYHPPLRAPLTDEQDVRDSMAAGNANAFEDSACYQRARILERAAHYDRSPPRVSKNSEAFPRSRRRKQSGLDTTARERRLFEEAYARFASRLSTLSRQARDEEEGEPQSRAMGKKAAESKMEGLKMATCLSDSVRECFTDPVVIELIKEVTMLRFHRRQEEEQEQREGMEDHELRPE